MTILVAMDSFKGSLSSSLANRAVKEGIHLIDSSERVRTVTVADGGKGRLRHYDILFSSSLMSIHSLTH